jgi:Ca-activated chloride channel homolog
MSIWKFRYRRPMILEPVSFVFPDGLPFRRRPAKRTAARAASLAMAAVLWLAPAASAYAETVAAKNKAGNRLFEQGRYQDAERAYLEAQAILPAQPELSYNLGNTLIKQKKYDQALPSLRQSIAKGDKGVQINSWYNTGNAHFDAGNYGDAAQAYIQALRLNPADRDAKHNLELALKRMQDQQQGQKQQQPDQKQGQTQQKPDESGQKEGPARKEPQPPGKQGQQPQKPQDQNPANPQPTQSNQPQGGFTRERALQILDALQNQELAEQRRLLESQARRKATGRDW